MARIDLRTVTLDIPPQDVITKDNVTVKVSAVLYFRVVDPSRAVTEVANYLFATMQLAQTTLRSVGGQTELDELLSQRDKLNARIQEIVDSQTEPWGVKVTLVELKNIDLPQDMQRAIAAQAEAERERRAKVIAAEGEFQASQRLADAAEIMSKSPITLQLRYLQTLKEIATENNSTTVFPMPIDLFEPFRAFAKAAARRRQAEDLSAASVSFAPNLFFGENFDPMGKLIMVRHGESEGNAIRRFTTSGEAKITDLGRRQALEAAQKIKLKYRADAVIASTFARARETGLIIAAELASRSNTRRSFASRASATSPDSRTNRSPTIPLSIRSARGFGARPTARVMRTCSSASRRCSTDVAKKYPDDEIVIVSHGGVMRRCGRTSPANGKTLTCRRIAASSLIEHRSGRYREPEVVYGEPPAREAADEIQALPAPGKTESRNSWLRSRRSMIDPMNRASASAPSGPRPPSRASRPSAARPVARGSPRPCSTA